MVDKLHIEPKDTQSSQIKGFDVQFNPSSYSITKPVSWTSNRDADLSKVTNNRELDAPQLKFAGGGSRTLVLRLFFDVTEGPSTDVRTETNKLVQLTRIEPKRGQPPICRITWSKQTPDKSDFPFEGVVTNLVQSFVLFRNNTAEPLRANVDVTFLEFIDAEDNKKETDPDFTTYVVKRGDTLSRIAAVVYRDPRLWRVIADANRIDDPRAVRIGVRLAIPALGQPR